MVRPFAWLVGRFGLDALGKTSISKRDKRGERSVPQEHEKPPKRDHQPKRTEKKWRKNSATFREHGKERVRQLEEKEKHRHYDETYYRFRSEKPNDYTGKSNQHYRQEPKAPKNTYGLSKHAHASNKKKMSDGWRAMTRWAVDIVRPKLPDVSIG